MNAISPQSVGFFICTSEKQVKSVLHYCLRCHCAVPAHMIKQCPCSSAKVSYKLLLKAEEQHVGREDQIMASIAEEVNDRTTNRNNPLDASASSNLNTAANESPADIISKSSPAYSPPFAMPNERNGNNSRTAQTTSSEITPAGSRSQLQETALQSQGSANLGECESEDVGLFDVTGLFFWCPSKKMDDCLLSPTQNQEVTRKLRNHIILCLTYRSQGSLRNFILPLRSSSLMSSQLHTLVIVAESKKFVEQEWNSIKNFPKIYVKIGSPLNRGVLRSIFIEKCHMCVVHSVQASNSSDLPIAASSSENKNSTISQDDSKALLITLNIKNMTYKNALSKCNSDAFDILHKLLYARKESCFKFDTDVNNNANASAVVSGSNSIPLLTELSN
ncbi:hypothetical protein HELRODRAFT_170319 [Helobdella robusta]|uniref:RCK N-terminal domain-containing protein n=1 Tax=Helobdella robusta TaxID=6412 RepID=T1F2X2_HELRO|nr:hypothetical protein HELRODRAFT_170319 [Helobdella robusta]ESO07768.1 hypothetical protein HELRODRAFT_170319 [Helobdella robusta]